ncbi:MAG: amidohydrolase [candidate division Zixibacteria bacterium]|nr:amidohydrolase [candidate division Zixibacteria bacterium]
MNHKPLLGLFVAISALGVLGCSNNNGHGPDLIVVGAVVRTMVATENGDQPTAEAVAVTDGIITAVGSRDDLVSSAGNNTRIIELDSGVVLPGLIDSHCHILNLGRFLERINLLGTKSAGDVRRKILSQLDKTSLLAWIRGRGWDQNDWETKTFPSWKDLAGTESNPVYLTRVDGHAIWVNKTALEIAKITAETPDPPGGRIVRDSNGEPTGIFIDNAIELISKHIEAESFEHQLKMAKLAIKECNRFGLVGVHDCGLDSLGIEVYRTLQSSGKLDLRVYGMLDGSDSALIESWFSVGPSIDSSGLFSIRTIKIYADGALGSRGAALLAPYDDDPENSGLLLTAPESIEDITVSALENGFQVAIHAIGDRGCRTALDAYETAFASAHYNNSSNSRFRIEHAQVIALEDIPRFAQLGVIPAMQPTHCTSDMYWAEDRVGSERIQGAYAWRKLINAGSIIPLGSDFPVESVNPLWGIYAAVTRQDHEGWPEGGWYAQEKLTIEEAVRGFTLDAAFAEFAEDTRGSIEIGKRADFTILNRDIFEIEHSEILNTLVSYTIVGGRIVYESR